MTSEDIKHQLIKKKFQSRTHIFSWFVCYTPVMRVAECTRLDMSGDWQTSSLFDGCLSLLFVFMLDEGLLRVSRVCVTVYPTCSLLHIPVSVVVYTCPLLQLRLCWCVHVLCYASVSVDVYMIFVTPKSLLMCTCSLLHPGLCWCVGVIDTPRSLLTCTCSLLHLDLCWCVRVLCYTQVSVVV